MLVTASCNVCFLQCDRKEALDVLHSELLESTAPDVAILGAGCSTATEAVAELAQFYSLPVVSDGKGLHGVCVLGLKVECIEWGSERRGCMG